MKTESANTPKQMKRVDEIEMLVAQGKMTAHQCYTQMKQLIQTPRPGHCPWCNGDLRVEYEKCLKLCDYDPDRQWLLTCQRCAADGPPCRTQLDALKMLPEPQQVAERLRLFPVECTDCKGEGGSFIDSVPWGVYEDCETYEGNGELHGEKPETPTK